MKYIDDFRRKDLAQNLIKEIKNIFIEKDIINLMEVCGTHTHAIYRFGIRSILPKNVNLISGPGCPVCVTPNGYIDHALTLAKAPNAIITTFGDMIRVPGSYSSLEKEKSQGADVRMVYSPLDALKIAIENPYKNIIFLGIGFETTAPTVASAVLEAKEKKISNFFILSGFKTLPQALKILSKSPSVKIDGFIGPGHLSVITGIQMYKDICRQYGIGTVITGFELLDILDGIRMLLLMISYKKPDVKIAYSRAVRPLGNLIAQNIIRNTFDEVDSQWRGLGVISKSGLSLKDEFSCYDAKKMFQVSIPKPKYEKNCICGLVLTGVKKPIDCINFRTKCNPQNPLGPCMVSSEGTCSAYYSNILINTK